MALDPLASVADLAALKVDTSDPDLCDALIASASAAIREAAGCSISTTTGTVVLDGGMTRHITLPGYAVRSVESVLWDGNTVTDWRLRGNLLFRAYGWGGDFDPPEITVTYTQGLDEVPADIVNLVASLVAAGIAASKDGYDPHRGISSERIDDYQRSFTRGDDEVVAPMELPASTRLMLANRFGGGVVVTQART